jgi:L-threonylcarbamoyladenylate synthase
MMKTLLTNSPRKAAGLILRGEIVAFPTETVYGLGANVFDEKALLKIFIAKKRPTDNPFIAHVAHAADISLLAKKITPTARLFIKHFFPGPLTLVLPKRTEVSSVATAGLPTIAIRMPKHPVARALLLACGVPLAAPSANLSGRPSSTTWQSVVQDLDGRIGGILKGGRTSFGLESTVVDCTGSVPRVLRSGAVTLEQLQKIVPSTRLAVVRKNAVPRSPGLKHRHYSPRARVVIVSGRTAAPEAPKAGYIGIDLPPGEHRFRLKRICKNAAVYAHDLYAFFRRCDRAGLSVVYCQSVTREGIGLALMDRIQRASEG